MAFTSGTAIGHNDLLDRLNTWLTVTTADWTELEYTAAQIEATSVDSIQSGGINYAVSDTITLTGGTFTTATILTVTSVSGGAVTGVSIQTPGVYSVAPTDPVAQGSTSGSGSGATFNMTYLPAVDTDIATLSIETLGNGPATKVYVNIDTLNDVGNGFYGWRVYGATTWIASTPFGSLPGASHAHYVNLGNGSIDYWFYGNTRRFIMVARVNTNYVSLYAGFFLPFALPSEYPFPHCVIGNYVELNSPGLNNARNSSIADPGDGGCASYLRRTTVTWQDIGNQQNSGVSRLPTTGQRAFIWPHKTGRAQAVNDPTSPEQWSGAGFQAMKLNAQNESPLIQCHIVDLLDLTLPGALEGVFSVTGFNRTPEQVITQGGRSFRLFTRAAGRTEPGDFFAVEEL